MEIAPRISVDAAKCSGKPCIRDLRVRVVDVLEMLAGGSSRAEILADFPYLEDEDITAALSYAAFLAQRPVALPVSNSAEVAQAAE